MARKTQKIESLLIKYYGKKILHRSNAVDELVLTILSQNTNDKNRDKAFQSLKHKYSSWNHVIASRPKAVADAIKTGGLANIKSVRIMKILKEIQKSSNGLNLDYLMDMPLEKAWETLQEFNGVGPKTAACVLLFSFGRPVMPKDTHILRIGKRLGLIPSDFDAAKAHKWIHDLKLPVEILSFHLNLIEHGRKICRPKNPQCPNCFLNQLCDYTKSQ